MLQLVTITSADSDCTDQVPIKIFCFGHRQSGLVAERSVGVSSLQLLKPLVTLREIIPLGSQATNNNIIAKFTTLVAKLLHWWQFTTLVAAKRGKWLNCLLFLTYCTSLL